MLGINDIIIFIGLIFAFILTAKFDGVKSLGTDENFKITVIIPARDEAHNISGILRDLQNQDYQIHEIICVDDSSRDNTSAIAKDFGATIIPAGDLPDGWKGKPWACHVGAQNATGDILLFIDADVRFCKDALSTLVSNFKKENSCVSVQPHHTMQKPYEQLSLFFNYIEVIATGIGLPLKAEREGLFGPVFMISKQLFLEMGGYEAVKNEAVEDFTLGRKYARKGIDLRLFLGADKISFRMYPKGITSLLEGWIKNFSTGAIRTRWWIFIMIVVYMGAMTCIPIEILRNALAGDTVKLLYICAAYAAYALHLCFSSQRLGTFKFASCLIFPIELAAFHLIFIYSFISTFLLKTTTWKGRRL